MSYSKEVSAMLQYMKDSGVPFTPPTPGMINEGVHTAGSYHYRLGTGGRGLAVDFNGPDERAIFNALGRVASQLAELIYVAPGITQNVKNGKWVPIYDHAANARNHVHVAVNVGTFLLWKPANLQEASKMTGKQAVAILSTNDGKGYWIVASDGGVFTFGDAPFVGSEGARTVNAPIVDATVTPDGLGMWLLGADGGVFTEGKAAFYGAATDYIK